MIQNNQAPQKRNWDPDGRLEVFKVWKTIQGEGPYAGTPAVFIRLAGCNLQCDFCDTIYTGPQVQSLSVHECMALVHGLSHNCRLVVITGGEPFRQNVAPLCKLLHSQGYHLQIETNGTLGVRDLPYPGVLIVCSPKTPSVHPEIFVRAHSWKYVLEDGYVSDVDGLPTRILGKHSPARPPKGARIYVQPLDEANEEANQRHMKAAVKSCMTFGHLLCLQMHKIIGLE